MSDVTNMKSVVAFLTRYVAADHDAAVGQYLDRQPNEFLARVRHLQEFFGDDVSTGIPLSLPELDDEDRAIFTRTAASLVTRHIFKVKRWDHPQQGAIYQAYLGSSDPSETTGYFESLIIKALPDGLKIVSRYVVCLACFASGLLDGKRCPDCSAPGWDYRQGLNLKRFGKAQEALHLEAPTNPAFLPEYEGDFDLDLESEQ